jgi:hypothetical protein
MTHLLIKTELPGSVLGLYRNVYAVTAVAAGDVTAFGAASTRFSCLPAVDLDLQLLSSCVAASALVRGGAGYERLSLGC